MTRDAPRFDGEKWTAADVAFCVASAAGFAFVLYTLAVIAGLIR